MSKKQHDTPMLDQLESGPWPSFVTGLKRLAKDNDYMTDLMGQLEHSYKTRKGYWKGGTVGVFGYGGGVIPRFSEVAEMFPASKEFHTLRVQPPAGMHYNTDVLRKMCDIWEKHGSGLIAFHGQSGDIMFQGASTANVQGAFDELNELGFDLGGAGPAVRTSMSCVGAARCEQSCFDEARAHRVIAGADDKGYRSELEMEAHRQGVAERVSFTGTVTEEEKWRLYEHCTAMIFPSLAEGFGLPVLEAMAFGKPVFLSDRTSLPEIGGTEAYYFKNFTPEHVQQVFSEGMNNYKNDPAKPQRLKKHTEKFTWDNAASAYLQFYQSILDG